MNKDIEPYEVRFYRSTGIANDDIVSLYLAILKMFRNRHSWEFDVVLKLDHTIYIALKKLDSKFRAVLISVKDGKLSVVLRTEFSTGKETIITGTPEELISKIENYLFVGGLAKELFAIHEKLWGKDDPVNAPEKEPDIASLIKSRQVCINALKAEQDAYEATIRALEQLRKK